MKLAGNVALVTGSSRQMGRVIALDLAKHGANLVINGLTDQSAVDSTVAEARALGVKAIGVKADVRDPGAVQAMVDQAARDLGPIDILVNCPAPRPETHFEQMTLDEWKWVMSVVLDGAFVPTRAVIPGMLELGRGTIINISGLSGQTGHALRTHVSAAKWGLVGFTKSLAAEYLTRGIIANAVAPTMITGGSSGKNGSAPIGRQGTREEVAALCTFLASEDARYITGQVYAINGGAYI